MLFCLTIHQLLLNLKSELRIGFLDDVTLGGPGNVVSDDIAMIEVEAAKLGLQFNKSKCEITSKVNRQKDCNNRGTFDGFQFTDLHNLFLLGSPVMAGSGVDKALGTENN